MSRSANVLASGLASTMMIRLGHRLSCRGVLFAQELGVEQHERARPTIRGQNWRLVPSLSPGTASGQTSTTSQTTDSYGAGVECQGTWSSRSVS